MKIGIIQTRGIGDVIIAAPIALYHVRQGHQVHWPIDSRFIDFFQAAFPQIRFEPVNEEETGASSYAFFYGKPMEILQSRGCERTLCLYSYLSGADVVNAKLANSLKFDEYKYAMANVPFAEKWNLPIARDPAAEHALRDQLAIRGDYVLVHSEGSNFKLDIALPEDILAKYQVVHISPISRNPFDWISVIEGASMLVMVDSCFANLAEQLDIGRNRHFFLRSAVGATPVLRNAWTFH